MIQLIDRLWNQTKTVALISGVGMALISTSLTVLLTAGKAFATSIDNTTDKLGQVMDFKGVKS